MKISMLVVSLLVFMQNSTQAGLYEAAAVGDMESFNNLLMAGVDINEGRPLHYAIYYHQKEVVKMILNAHKMFPNVIVAINLKNPNGQTPLHMACAFGDCEIVEMLVQAGADIEVANNRGQTPLLVASLWGQSEIVQYLLSLNANIEKKCRSWGHRPLHLAVYRNTSGNLLNVQILIAAKAKIMAKNKSGGTPLHIASNNGFIDAMAMLLAAGANPNKQDNYGETPLHKAVAKGLIDNEPMSKDLLEDELPARDFAKATTLLLKAGANPNVGDISGLTPLHWAAINGLSEIVAKLLKSGADISLKTKKLKTKKRLTALQAAEEAGEHGVAQQIKNFDSRKEMSVFLLSKLARNAKSPAAMLPADMSIHQEIYEQLRRLPR